VSNLTEVDRLIEQGLGHYGQGDLNAALESWESALAIDPDNPQANSYVDYVRQNYELLTSEVADALEAATPFAIEDEPYQIEILPGELEIAPRRSASRLPSADPLDAGWFIEEELGVPRTASRDRAPLAFPATQLAGTPPIGFDDETREYPGGPPAAKARAGSEGPFETTTSGFGSQATELRKRDTGFVQPRSSVPELAITLRTPAHASRASTPETTSHVEVSYRPPTDAEPLPTRQPATNTRELPALNRPPAASAPTRELPPRNPIADAELALVSAPTRNLGLRDARAESPAPPTTPAPDDEPTKMRRKGEDATRADVILAFDPIDARAAQILDDIDVGAPLRESTEDRTRRRIVALFERAVEWNRVGEVDRAVAAIDLALSEDPNSALAQKLIHRNRDTMMTVFQQFLGDLERQPVLAKPLHELAKAPISPRAAFLLSRVDGALSLDEILDVSGMPRLEAYRYLCQLYLRGILR
jgi:tetratricopeptide (TPR) repeat protein